MPRGSAPKQRGDEHHIGLELHRPVIAPVHPLREDFSPNLEENTCIEIGVVDAGPSSRNSERSLDDVCGKRRWPPVQKHLCGHVAENSLCIANEHALAVRPLRLHQRHFVSER